VYLVATGGWAQRTERLASVLRDAGTPGLDPAAPGEHDVRIVAPSHAIVVRGARAGPPLTVVERGGRAIVLDGCATNWPADLGDVDLDDLWARLGVDEWGQFVGVSLRRDTDHLVLRTDPMGFRQAYYAVTGDGWLIGDSVRALVSLLPSASIDLLGAATHVAVGWPAGDRTLVTDVRVVPPASTWSWSAGEVTPVRSGAGDRFALYRPEQALAGDVRALRRDMADACARVGRQFDHLRSGLTGGRDSRVLLAVLRERGLDVEYFVEGDPASDEVSLSRHLAAVAGVPHRVVDKPPRTVVARWGDAADRLVRRTDGMVSLWQVADVVPVVTVPDGSLATYWGVGGEIGRGTKTNGRWYVMPKSIGTVTSHLTRLMLWGKAALLTPECRRVACRSIADFVDDAVAHAVALHDVPIAYQGLEQQRRASGTKSRERPPPQYLYTPFVTRPFVRASVALPPQRRYAEHLHHELVRPDDDLFRHPFISEPWRVQTPWLVLAQRGWRKRVAPWFSHEPPIVPTHRQREVLTARLPELRTRCLDDSSSAVWQLVDRDAFAGAKASDATRTERLDHVIYLAATVQAWELTIRRAPMS
jgi:hypothetical protein